MSCAFLLQSQSQWNPINVDGPTAQLEMRIADVSDSFRHWRTDTVRITVRLVWFLQGCVWSATLFVTQWRCCLIATMTIHGTGGKEYRCAKTCIRLVHVRSANEGILAAFQYIAASPRITFECCCRVFCKSNMVGSGPKKISGKTFKEVHLKSERDTLKGYIYISRYWSAVSSQYFCNICGLANFSRSFPGRQRKPARWCQVHTWTQGDLWCTSLSKPGTGIALSCSKSVAPTPDQSYHPWPLELFFLNWNSPRTIELANSIGAGLGGTGSSLEETVVQEEGCSLGTKVSALQSHPKVMVFDERRKYFWYHLPPVAPQRDYMPPGSKQASPFKPDLRQLLFIATLSRHPEGSFLQASSQQQGFASWILDFTKVHLGCATLWEKNWWVGWCSLGNAEK